MIDKEKIRRSFSRYARYYDGHSDIQNLSASKLISGLGNQDFTKILDIGCGTGNYTRLLRRLFPKAGIKAVDISDEMVGIARGKLKSDKVEFIVQDAEVMEGKEKFDLITSNATFQWFEDVERALIKYKGLLEKNGVIHFSQFGPRTFCELSGSLKEFFRKDIAINSSGFMSKSKMEKFLTRHYEESSVEEETYEEECGSLLELLKKIKYSGIRGNGIINNNKPWTQGVLDKLERIYRDRYSGPARSGSKDRNIKVTYQIFYCRAAR